MARSLSEAEVQRAFQRLRTDASRNMQRTVTATAQVMERQAKINASTGSHKKGTPTPAVRGQTGPARIRGNLVRSITRDPTVLRGTSWMTLVGVAGTADYGKHVEAMGFRFIDPAFVFGVRVASNVIYPREFSKWRRG